MSKTLRFSGFGLPKITPAEVKRFEAEMEIGDRPRFFREEGSISIDSDDPNKRM